MISFTATEDRLILECIALHAIALNSLCESLASHTGQDPGELLRGSLAIAVKTYPQMTSAQLAKLTAAVMRGVSNAIKEER